jgi:hypothetical protein
MGRAALLAALGYPKAQAFAPSDEAAFRGLITWLENVKVGLLLDTAVELLVCASAAQSLLNACMRGCKHRSGSTQWTSASSWGM